MYQVLLRQGQGRAMDGYIILYIVCIWYFFKITTLIDGKVVAPDARLIVCMLLIRHVWHAHSLSLFLSVPLVFLLSCTWRSSWTDKCSTTWILDIGIGTGIENEIEIGNGIASGSPSLPLPLSLRMCVLQVEFMCCNETFLQQFLAQLEVRETWQGAQAGEACQQQAIKL